MGKVKRKKVKIDIRIKTRLDMIRVLLIDMQERYGLEPINNAYRFELKFRCDETEQRKGYCLDTLTAVVDKVNELID